MKLSYIISALIVSTTTFAADDGLVRRSMEEIRASQQQTRALLNSGLSPAQTERVRYIDQRLMSAQSLLESALNSPGNPPPAYNSIELFHSDGCLSGLIGQVNYTTNCSAAFVNADDAWAVKLNGKCYDIADISATRACEVFKDANENSVKLFHSDTCSGKLVAMVGSTTNCRNLVGLDDVWAIEANGRCTDISDVAATTACERFKP